MSTWPVLVLGIYLVYSGASPGFGRGGGPRNFFFADLGICMSRSDMLRMAKPCALLGGFGGMPPRENFLKRCNLVRFRVYFDQILSLFFSKNAIFYIKNKYFNIHICYGVFLVKKFLKTCYDWCVLVYTLKLKWLFSLKK